MKELYCESTRHRETVPCKSLTRFFFLIFFSEFPLLFKTNVVALTCELPPLLGIACDDGDDDDDDDNNNNKFNSVLVC